MIKHTPLLLLLLFNLLAPNFAAAIDVQISNIAMKEEGRELLLSLKVENAFHEKLEEAILNGIPATFSFLIRLERIRDLWPDETVTEFTVTHSLKYHTLKNHFIITKSWENNKQMMSEINGLKLVNRDRMRTEWRYRVSAKAELDKVNLPFFLNYIFFFASMWDFETQWHSHEFLYPLPLLKGPEK